MKINGRRDQGMAMLQLAVQKAGGRVVFNFDDLEQMERDNKFLTSTIDGENFILELKEATPENIVAELKKQLETKSKLQELLSDEPKSVDDLMKNIIDKFSK